MMGPHVPNITLKSAGHLLQYCHRSQPLKYNNNISMVHSHFNSFVHKFVHGAQIHKFVHTKPHPILLVENSLLHLPNLVIKFLLPIPDIFFRDLSIFSLFVLFLFYFLDSIYF